MRVKRILLVALTVTVALVVCANSDEGEKPAPEAVKEVEAEAVKEVEAEAVEEEVTEPAQVDFQTPVVKLFAKRCAGCHGAEGGADGLALVEKPVVKGALVAGSSQMTEMKIVHPGHPEKSYLVMKVRGAEGIKGDRMPPSGDGLTDDEIAAVEAWIVAMGAPEEECEKTAKEMKAKEEAAKEECEESAEEMKAKKEALEEKAEEAMKAEEKAEEATGEAEVEPAAEEEAETAEPEETQGGEE